MYLGTRKHLKGLGVSIAYPDDMERRRAEVASLAELDTNRVLSLSRTEWHFPVEFAVSGCIARGNGHDVVLLCVAAVIDDCAGWVANYESNAIFDISLPFIIDAVDEAHFVARVNPVGVDSEVVNHPSGAAVNRRADRKCEIRGVGAYAHIIRECPSQNGRQNLKAHRACTHNLHAPGGVVRVQFRLDKSQPLSRPVCNSPRQVAGGSIGGSYDDTLARSVLTDHFSEVYPLFGHEHIPRTRFNNNSLPQDMFHRLRSACPTDADAELVHIVRKSVRHIPFQFHAATLRRLKCNAFHGTRISAAVIHDAPDLMLDGESKYIIRFVVRGVPSDGCAVSQIPYLDFRAYSRASIKPDGFFVIEVVHQRNAVNLHHARIGLRRSASKPVHGQRRNDERCQQARHCQPFEAGALESMRRQEIQA